MAKSRKRLARRRTSGSKPERSTGRDAWIQLTADGVALTLDPVGNPQPRGTFGSIGRFYRVSSDRAFSKADLLIPYESRQARSVDEDTLRLFRWDEESRSLVLVPQSGVNVGGRFVWGEIPSPGIYGLIGLPKDERVLRTIAVIAALDPARFRTDKDLLPKVCGLILCARGPAGGPGGGKLCELCRGLEIPSLGLPEGQLLAKYVPELRFYPRPPPPKGAPWPMYGHDPRHTGKSAYTGPATQPSVLWTFTPSLTTWPQMTSPQLAHPVVAEDGTVYVGALGLSFSGVPEIAIWALDGATGARKWSHGWVALPSAGTLTTPQPAVGIDGTIYVNCGSLVFAFRPDGAVKWAVSPWNVFPQPPLPSADGTVYVFNRRYVPGTPQIGLFALDAATGSLKWPGPFDTGMSGLLPMAVRDDGSIIVAGAHIWALSPNRTVQWQRTLSGVMALEGSPAVGDDGTVYVGVRPVPLTTGSLRALGANGSAKAGWTTPQWGLTTPALADASTILIGFQDQGSPWGGAKIDARNADGTLKWSRAILGEVPEAPAIGADGTIYLASGAVPGDTYAAVYALDPSNGLDRWTFPLGPLAWSAKSPAIGLNATLYVTDASSGTLYALK